MSTTLSPGAARRQARNTAIRQEFAALCTKGFASDYVLLQLSQKHTLGIETIYKIVRQQGHYKPGTP